MLSMQTRNGVKTMDEQRKEKLTKIYKAYNTFDWILVILIIGTPIALLFFDAYSQGLGIGGIAEINGGTFEALMYRIGSLPAAIIVPIFVLYTAYTVFCFVLYVKVWPIKEIRNTATYWWDWVLSILVAIYELFIFYAILFG